MGNCMERFGESEEMKIEQEQQEEETRKVGFVVKEGDELVKANVVKVKIVLTREELEWLMLQLKNNEGKKLEEILGEIGRGRVKVKVEAWRPSLESIMEIPEVLDMDR